MTHTIVANEPMQRWVADAAAFPRAIPARLRGLLEAGLTSHEGGVFFTAELRPDIDLPTGSLERFTNTVRLDTLKPVQRLTPGTDFWTYECVAIGIALGDAVLALDPTVTVVVTVDVADVEHPDAEFWFGREAAASAVDWERAELTMTA
jgi:hypothetical protein